MKKRILSVIICTALIFSLGTGLVSAETITFEVDPVYQSLPPHLLETFRHFGREPQLFDDVLDQIYFNHFGEGFPFMMRHSKELNEIITYGDFNVELLSAVAIAGEERPAFSFDDETETYTEDWSNSSRDVSTFIFLSIRDESEEINFSDGSSTLRAAAGLWGISQLLFYDEETATAYFVLEAFYGMSNEDSISLDFGLDRIFSDIHEFNEIIEIDLAELLENHEAATTTEDSGMIFGMSWGPNTEEILGEEFSENLLGWGIDAEFSVETLVRDELNITLCQVRHLSNVALKGDFLHLQLYERILDGGAWPPERQSFLSLIDTRSDDHMHHLYSFLLEERDEEYNLVNDQRHEEQVYHFPDADIMNYLAISIGGFYYNTIKALNISASFDLPVVIRNIVFEEGLKVEILSELYNIVDINIMPTNISYTIENGLILRDDADRWPDYSEARFDPWEHVEVILVYYDGTEHEFHGNSGTWGAWIHGPIADEEFDELTDLHVSFRGSAVDLDNLVAIRINGELLQLQ